MAQIRSQPTSLKPLPVDGSIGDLFKHSTIDFDLPIDSSLNLAIAVLKTAIYD